MTRMLLVKIIISNPSKPHPLLPMFEFTFRAIVSLPSGYDVYAFLLGVWEILYQ
jgi:hypothetical protein